MCTLPKHIFNMGIIIPGLVCVRYPNISLTWESSYLVLYVYATQTYKSSRCHFSKWPTKSREISRDIGNSGNRLVSQTVPWMAWLRINQNDRNQSICDNHYHPNSIFWNIRQSQVSQLKFLVDVCCLQKFYVSTKHHTILSKRCSRDANSSPSSAAYMRQ